MLIFLHLPKTAGTTLAHILARQYGDAAVLRLYDSTDGEELATYPTAHLDTFRVIMGHFSFGAHRFLAAQPPYVTVLREPISRVASHYYFVRRSPTHYLYEAARRLSLSEFVLACGSEEPNNDQTRLLAGDERVTGPIRSGQHLLAAAKQHLREHFVVTGLTEEFDRSILLMKRALGWKAPPFYARENVSRRRAAPTLPTETLRVVVEHNRLDLDLYQYARELFDAQVRLHGESLDAELRGFTRLNAVRGRLYDLTRLPNLIVQTSRR